MSLPFWIGRHCFSISTLKTLGVIPSVIKLYVTGFSVTIWATMFIFGIQRHLLQWDKECILPCICSFSSPKPFDWGYTDVCPSVNIFLFAPRVRRCGACKNSTAYFHILWVIPFHAFLTDSCRSKIQGIKRPGKGKIWAIEIKNQVQRNWLGKFEISRKSGNNQIFGFVCCSIIDPVPDITRREITRFEW